MLEKLTSDAWHNVAASLIGRDDKAQTGVGEAELLSDWTERVAITLEGRRLGFDERPWLRELYEDTHRHVVLIKATQIGGSVWAILRCIHLARVMPGWRGWVYWFPTKSDVLDFSQTRVKPLIEAIKAA